MTTHSPRKLTACFASIAIAASGLIAGGVTPAHAAGPSTTAPTTRVVVRPLRPSCSAFYSISVGNYANHGQNDAAYVSTSCENQLELKMTVNWGDGHQDYHQCYASCSSLTNDQYLHTYANAGVYSVCTWDDYGNGHVCVQVHIL